MKKIIVTLFIVLGACSGYASAGEVTVSKKVLNAFKHDFTQAQEVEWTAGENYFKAAFYYYDQYVFAFYDPDGELYGTARYVSSLDLPLNLMISLRNDYSRFWITDLFEVSKKETTTYYITLEDADSIVQLKSSGNSEWITRKKTKKS